MRGNEEARSNTTPASLRQLRELNVQNKDMRPGAQLKASQQQHSELCKQLQGAEITPHNFSGCG
eukprot:1156139-Pelagomonas_calceolata.AAC.8